VRLAKLHAVALRQSYARVGKLALIQRQRYADAKQFKRANRMLKKLRTYLGCVIRDIGRKIEGNGGRAVAPGVLACVEDVGLGLEHPVGSIGLAQILPDIFGWVELRTSGWQRHEGDIGRGLEFACRVPCGLVEDQQGMRTGRGITQGEPFLKFSKWQPHLGCY
jgi:hypothetical protein